MKNILNRSDVIRLYTKMREKDVSTSQICKALNIDYPCFKAMIDGKQPCYRKWKKTIADILQTDEEEIFAKKDDAPQIFIIRRKK